MNTTNIFIGLIEILSFLMNFELKEIKLKLDNLK
jgi:hypothetical protein